MNPSFLYTLTPAQKQQYLVQPDEFPGFKELRRVAEYELPPYVEKRTYRFWYNDQAADFSTHWHAAQEIIIPLEGEYVVTVRDTTYRLEPGDIFLIPSGELHSLEAPSAGSRFIFLFELDPLGRLEDFSYIRPFLSKPVHITAETCPAIYEKEIALMMQTAAYYWGDSPVKQMHIYSCLLRFYACYADHYSSQGFSLTQAFPDCTLKNASRQLNPLLQYLEQHYAEKTTLEDAAGIVHLSKFYFTRIFKQYTGQTFYDYLNMLRIQASETLLKDTDASIKHVAAACGYPGISTFNRTFRKFKGCSPSEFRKFYGHGM